MHTIRYVRITAPANLDEFSSVNGYLPEYPHAGRAWESLVGKLAVLVDSHMVHGGGPRPVAVVMVGKDSAASVTQTPLVLVPSRLVVPTNPELGELLEHQVMRMNASRREPVVFKEGQFARVRLMSELMSAFGKSGDSPHPAVRNGWNSEMTALCGEVVLITKIELLHSVRSDSSCQIICSPLRAHDHPMVKAFCKWRWSSDTMDPVVPPVSEVDRQLHAVLYDRVLENPTSVRFTSAV